MPNGPDPAWRYVINPYDSQIMDMRHVVVVGYAMGEGAGLLLEYTQKYGGKIFNNKGAMDSAFVPMDKYSNNIGARFFKYDFRTYGIHMSNNFGLRLGEFLNKVYKNGKFL